MHYPIRVLFLCTHNSARSQMAQGLLQFLGKGDFDVHSAGSDPTALHPLAIQVMREGGIDIAHQRSKHLNDYLDHKFDYIITVCERTQEICPTFPGDTVCIHWNYPDPTAVTGDEAAQRRAFRKVFNELRERIHLWILNQRKLLRESGVGSGALTGQKDAV